MITEFNKFQLEATKLGRSVVFQVTVFQKRERNRTKLFAETQCTDPFHFVIQFIIREAPTFDVLMDKFLRQLYHRGFAPLRFRIRGEGKWEGWQDIDPEKIPAENINDAQSLATPN